MEFQSHPADEYDNLIKPIELAAKFICIWPLDKDRSTGAVIFRICHLSGLFLLLLTAGFTVTVDMIFHLDNLEQFTDCALIGTAFYLAVLRVTIYTLHQKDIMYITETMRIDWVLSSYEDRIILRKKCLFAFQLTKYFIVTVVITIIFFSSVPILEMYFLGIEEKILPFRGHFFINQTISPIYECLYIVNVMAGCFGGGTIVGATCFNLVTVIHGSAKFAILRQRLERINNSDPSSSSTVAKCVKCHQDAIAFADALEKTLNILALGQFIMSTGLVCLAGFQITLMMHDKGRLMKYSAFLNSAIIELFMFSFSGNGLIDESNAVGESAYCSDWIGSTFTQNLQIMMMRAKIPSKITAAKFYNLSFESFARVLSTSFSYMMVLMATNEN